MTRLVALVLGVIYCFGFAPFGFWPATFVAIAGLYLVLLKSERPTLDAWLFGVGKYALGVSWVYVSIHVHGNAPPMLAGGLVILFVVGMALFCAPIGWLFGRYRANEASSLTHVALFAGAFALMDWMLTWFLTGFPWLLPGYAFLYSVASGLVPVVGTLGLGLAITLSAAAAAHLAGTRRLASGALALVALPFVAGAIAGLFVWAEPVSRHQVALVQGNLDQQTKWLPENRGPNAVKHLELSAPHWDAELVVWPEAAVTTFASGAGAFLAQLSERALATDTNVVVGIPGVRETAEGEYAFQNLALGVGLARGRFAKHHLVPFGEYVPLESVLRGLIQFFDLPMSHAAPGAAYQPNIALSFGEAAMAICYEVAYPETMRRHAASAALLMTISNDTWFGDSIGPLQHLEIAQMRALENARWLVRATNNGVTAIVDPRGRVTARLPQFEAGVLRGEVAAMTGRTPYSRLGHWPFFVAVGVCFVLGVRRGSQREQGAAAT